MVYPEMFMKLTASSFCALAWRKLVLVLGQRSAADRSSFGASPSNERNFTFRSAHAIRSRAKHASFRSIASVGLLLGLTAGSLLSAATTDVTLDGNNIASG